MRELAPEKVVRKRSDKRNACIGTPVKRKWLVTVAARTVEVKAGGEFCMYNKGILRYTKSREG